MVALQAIPSASVATAANVKPGSFAKVRTARNMVPPLYFMEYRQNT
jgi:hypothetical protein